MRAILPTALISALNGARGAECIAAASMLNFSRSYPLPEDFSPCICVLQFDGAAIAVAFARSGDKAISAAAYPLFIDAGPDLARVASEIPGALSGELP